MFQDMHCLVIMHVILHVKRIPMENQPGGSVNGGIVSYIFAGSSMKCIRQTGHSASIETSRTGHDVAQREWVM